jgi:hypothetical protein
MIRTEGTRMLGARESVVLSPCQTGLGEAQAGQDGTGDTLKVLPRSWELKGGL